MKLFSEIFRRWVASGNSAIFKTEIRIREGEQQEFTVSGNQADAINTYVSSRDSHYGCQSNIKTAVGNKGILQKDGTIRVTDEKVTVVKFN